MKTDVGRTEKLVGFGILMMLIIIAAGVYMKQYYYDPSIYTVSLPKGDIPPVAGSVTARQSSPGKDLTAFLPANLKLMGNPEVFGPDNLSDKIDGKAELYLSAGFISLLCQRFSAKDNPNSWMEVYVYDMGDHRSAFAVYSTQRRPDVEKVDFAQFAYRTGNALFFADGKEYVEIVASDDSKEMAGAMVLFAKSFIGHQPDAPGAPELNEAALFPKEHLKEGSIALLSKDVFGCAGLDNVYKAAYDVAGARMTGFLSLRGSPREASERLDLYHRFLLENGGSDVPLGKNLPGAVLVRIFDTFDLMFTKGRIFGGVHEADSQASAEELGSIIYQALPGASN
jgi:hypothetical protein